MSFSLRQRAFRSLHRLINSPLRISVFGMVFIVVTLIIVTASTKAYGSGTDGVNFDGPAELPRIYLQSTLADTPAPGNTIQVNIGGDLQSALNHATCGDTLDLEAGATFAGTFTLPAHSCDDEHWIIVRTSAPDSLLPPEGTRISPCYGGVAALPGRPDFHCSSTANVMARIVVAGPGVSGTLLIAPGANHYRLVGLEITRPPKSGPTVNLIQAEADSNDIVLDRVWVHGTSQDDTRRGILLSGMTNVAIVDSFFNDFHCVSKGSCTDSQAIGGGSSDLPGGPYKIADNFLEASGECILFGGDPSTTTATDIEIRHNHLFKPLIWQSGHAGFVGGRSGNPFIVKNHFELKNAQRVLFEGNILENNWGGFTQLGFSIVLTPKGYISSHDGAVNQCPTCKVTDVTIRYNTVSHIGAGFVIATALAVGNGVEVPALEGARYSIHDVVLDDIDSQKYLGSGTLLLLANGWSKNVLNTVVLNHITAWPNIHLITLENSVFNPMMTGFVFTNNIVSAGQYPVWPGGGGNTNCALTGTPLTNLSECLRNYAFVSNVIVSPPAGNESSDWPSGNYFARDSDAVGFVNFDQGNYELLPSSPYKNKGTDGKDIGADINSIQLATAGAD
ncbi:MAG: hypothetical protein ACRD2U_17655 [Terriglobales bacterium]